MPSFPRGAIPSPRHRLAAACPHTLSAVTPPNTLWMPEELSFWLNDVDGDCVTAEEAFAKGCSKITITDAEVASWANSHGFLNGAILTDVLDAMESSGFESATEIFNDGPATSVDWTNPAILQNAISLGPVKLGVAADQLQNVVTGDPPRSGWVATGFTATDEYDEDHCVSLAGFGTFQWLAAKIGSKLPAGIDPSTPGYALFTWSSIGIIDEPSMLAITHEAWLRSPTSITRANGA